MINTHYAKKLPKPWKQVETEERLWRDWSMKIKSTKFISSDYLIIRGVAWE